MRYSDKVHKIWESLLPAISSNLSDKALILCLLFPPMITIERRRRYFSKAHQYYLTKSTKSSSEGKSTVHISLSDYRGEGEEKMRGADELVPAAHAAQRPRAPPAGSHCVGRHGHHGHGARALGNLPLDGQPLCSFQG